RARVGVFMVSVAPPPRPLHQRRLRCFFLMSRPPLLLLRRGVRLEPVPRLGLRSNLIRNLDTCAFSRGGNNILVSTQRWETGNRTNLHLKTEIPKIQIGLLSV